MPLLAPVENTPPGLRNYFVPPQELSEPPMVMREPSWFSKVLERADTSMSQAQKVALAGGSIVLTVACAYVNGS